MREEVGKKVERAPRKGDDLSEVAQLEYIGIELVVVERVSQSLASRRMSRLAAGDLEIARRVQVRELIEPSLSSQKPVVRLHFGKVIT